VITVDLAGLGFDRGGHLLVNRALTEGGTGARVMVTGSDPNLAAHLAGWARRKGHRTGMDNGTSWVERGPATADRWAGSERAGDATPGAVVSRAEAHWGLAARGALVEAGGPALDFSLAEADLVWADIAPKLYSQAAASQWDPATAVPWDAAFDLPRAVEESVVQVMTYLVENEQAALVVPARFVGRIHPHYREAVQFLAVQVADEARHVEVFARRALLRSHTLGTSTVGGRVSLGTLLEEQDFALASFLLSVLGEGSFLHLLSFLDRHAPDPVTQRVAHLAREDEARHVAFAQAHLEHQMASDSSLRDRLRAAVERRHRALATTAGLNDDVFDALVILAAGVWTPEAVARGWDAVQQLQADMDEGRQRRLNRLGFSATEAADLSARHTRNFM
jgi:hypothetical protein